MWSLALVLSMFHLPMCAHLQMCYIYLFYRMFFFLFTLTFLTCYPWQVHLPDTKASCELLSPSPKECHSLMYLHAHKKINPSFVPSPFLVLNILSPPPSFATCILSFVIIKLHFPSGLGNYQQEHDFLNGTLVLHNPMWGSSPGSMWRFQSFFVALSHA